ncbi:nuclease-related domain-containing protein [Salsuginibacillus kocurii]|uniref:nuclease-related domain-containing protein n=1 Tax=Salsuginibacillus kocurii TaxID=427078 RepID=UPI0003A87622|nr:nuclease-related domain-containing protein [Salsuginibacillus kocurii]
MPITIKPRTKSTELSKLETLARRLPARHPSAPRINDDLAQTRAGYHGEQSIEYYLHTAPASAHLLHDLRLKGPHNYFQLDLLIITASTLHIIEIKNIAGTIHYDPRTGQATRTLAGQTERIRNPLHQIKRQHAALSHWLSARAHPQLPIHTTVIFTNPDTILDTNCPAEFHQSEQLPELFQHYDPDTVPHTELSRDLAQSHKPLNRNLLEKYKIDRHALTRGVYCAHCESRLMQRQRYLWRCPSCAHTSRTAHHTALNEYALLFGNTITNKQAREFLNIRSRTTARTLLRSMRLVHNGKQSNRVYYLK